MGNRITPHGQKLNTWRQDRGPKPPKQQIPAKKGGK